MKRLVVVSPVLLTIFLLVWWALTEKYSYYGSWYVDPALAILPVVLLWHGGLVVWNRPRSPFVVFALVHLIVFVPIWFNVVMSLSHDSL
jgi:hypothetical protein